MENSYGATIIETLRACQQYGYDEANKYIERGTYISPRLLFEDIKHKLPKNIFNYQQFKVGVLRAVEESRNRNELYSINTIKKNVEEILRELD